MVKRRIAVLAELDSIPRLAAAADEFCAECQLAVSLKDELSLVLEELLTNLVVHGTRGARGYNAEVAFTCDDSLLTVVFTDDGPAFNPCSHPMPMLEGDVEDRPVGGLGIHLIRTLMNRIEYTRLGKRNCLALHKQLKRN
jgi:anti-sigma regulatory factor (Ser/Thr protein kinase)